MAGSGRAPTGRGAAAGLGAEERSDGGGLGRGEWRQRAGAEERATAAVRRGRAQHGQPDGVVSMAAQLLRLVSRFVDRAGIRSWYLYPGTSSPGWCHEPGLEGTL